MDAQTFCKVLSVVAIGLGILAILVAMGSQQ
jgi:hypothetical protein